MKIKGNRKDQQHVNHNPTYLSMLGLNVSKMNHWYIRKYIIVMPE